MKREELAEILACLPDEFTFPYFKDRYALMLLADFVGEGKSVAEVKASRFARLLDRPGMKPLLALAGGGKLTRDMLESHWPADYRDVEAFSITLGSWGEQKRWSREGRQMARRGYNLVLQLNFSGTHAHTFKRLFGGCGMGAVFTNHGHPVNQDGKFTMAWARLDLDFTTGEVLIEEVQNDWLRRAKSAHKAAKANLHKPADAFQNVEAWQQANARANAICMYVEKVLWPFWSLWSEAILMAAIWLTRRELGMSRMYFYEHETGNRLKGLDGCALPPKSLYTQLPKSFCMEKREGLPGFLASEPCRSLQKIVKRQDPVFWRLAA